MPVTVEYDKLNEFDWSERSTYEYVLFNRTYVEVTTTFDDSHIQVDYYREGIRNRTEVSDPENALPFQKRVILYETNGDIRSMDTVDDDDQNTVTTYENGVPISSTVSDTTDVRPWSTIDITYKDGEVSEFKINYEAPHTSADTGGSANFLTEIDYDEANVEDWMFMIRGRSGTSNWVQTFYDHGGQKRESYTDGIITGIEENDYGNVEDWISTRTLFDAEGTITTRFTFNDNGSSFTETFEDGNLVRTRLQDEGTDPVYRSIETFFDADGVMTSRVTVNDVMPVITETFEAGVLVSIKEAFGTTETSPSVETFYDAEGNAVSQTTIDLNGDATTQILRVTTVRVDDADAASWAQITTVADGDGALIERETYFDDGKLREETFEEGLLVNRETTEADGDISVDTFVNGTRASIFRADVSDSKSWDALSITYDAAGLVSQKEMIFDDGGSKHDNYLDGVRTQSHRIDGGDTKSWSQISVYYDQDGDIESRETSYDNGSTALNVYYAGVLEAIIRTDVADTFNWNTVASSYENGVLSGRKTVYDNADEMVMIYEDQERVARLKVDGDDSHAWAVQVTDYGQATPVTTTYNALEDVPADYTAFLQSDAFIT